MLPPAPITNPIELIPPLGADGSSDARFPHYFYAELSQPRLHLGLRGATSRPSHRVPTASWRVSEVSVSWRVSTVDTRGCDFVATPTLLLSISVRNSFRLIARMHPEISSIVQERKKTDQDPIKNSLKFLKGPIFVFWVSCAGSRLLQHSLASTTVLHTVLQHKHKRRVDTTAACR